MFAFAHVFSVHLECQRPGRPEAQRILVVQADDMTPARAPVAQHLPHRVEHAQRAELAQREQVKAGVEARLTIGYRAAPFLSHAWVEVDGRVVNDSQAYKERLQVLCSV